MPCLFCIYYNNYDVINHIWILAGFAFYAIAGNTLNDFFDMENPEDVETLERVEGYSRKEIFVLFLCNFVLGNTCFMNPILERPVLAIYLAITVILVVLYCMFKSLVFINHVLLGVSHMFLPWFMIKINAGNTIIDVFPNLSLDEWMILFSASSLAFTGQMLHEQIDGDSITRFSLKTIQRIVWISAIISMIIGTISLILTQLFMFMPFVLFPIGLMYIYRKPRDLRGISSLKDIGIIMGNLVFGFVVILIIAS